MKIFSAKAQKYLRDVKEKLEKFERIRREKFECFAVRGRINHPGAAFKPEPLSSELKQSKNNLFRNLDKRPYIHYFSFRFKSVSTGLMHRPLSQG